MPVISSDRGIELVLPDNVAVQQRPVGTRRRGGEAPETIDGALLEAGYSVDAVVELTPVAVKRDRCGRPVALPAEAAVEPVLRVDVAPDEGAVALLESEGGVFAWLLPEESPEASRRGERVRTLEFPLANPVRPGGVSPGADRRGRRGLVSWIGNQLLEPIRIRVLRFAANVAIDLVVDKIEGDRPFGLVDMSGPVSAWRPGASLPKLGPEPARILLMVHGTFSSSLGSFGALDLTTAGRSFLDVARNAYEAILGFDHKTLADDPEQNARDILAALESLPHGSIIDSVAFSRGGLVLRALAEQIAPEERPDLIFDRAVFVGCTNAGTQLAEPDNWGALVDLYTNIVMAGARAIALLSANVAAEIIASGVSTIGRFVKFLPQLAIAEKRVPGLAAMEPGGEFVTKLNQAEPDHGGQAYHVIATDFEPRIEPSKGITGELAEYLIDRVVDRLFRQIDNDLVVNTASMSDFGKHGDRLNEADLFVIPSEDSVYHTIYFASERVGELLSRWLMPTALTASPEPPPPEPMPMPSDDLGEFAGGGGGSGLGGDATELTHTGFEPSLVDEYIVGRAAGRETRAAPDFSELHRATRRSDGSARRGYKTRTGRSLPAAEPTAAEPVVMNEPEERIDPTDPAKLEQPPADSIACHFAAEMQPTPIVGLPVPLFVTVSPERMSVAAGPTASATEHAVAVDKMKQIEVEVIPSRNCRIFGVVQTAPPASDKREEGPSLRKIDVPTKGAVSLRFELEGTAPGEAEVFIEARQGPRLLASFLLKPVFTLRSDARISASQIARPTFSGPDDPAVLRIYEMHMAHGALRLRFELSCEDPNIFVQDNVEFRSNFDVKAFVAGFLSMLEEAYDLPDYDQTLRKIRNFSKARTAELIPERVREELWNHRDEIRAIQVISEEPLIPWELLSISDPSGQNKEEHGFFAEWGLVRWMYNANWPSRKLSFGGARVFTVIPDYLDRQNQLKGAAEERETLATLFPGASEIEPTSANVIEFLRDKGSSCDLLHFACHGLAEQKAVLSSDLIMREKQTGAGLVDDTITQDDVKMEAAFGEHAPSGMVFVNACQTGRPGEGIAGVMGFADAFIRPMSQQGTNVFVGALWSVSDTLALTFARTFYEELLDGKVLVDAARAAREACKANQDFTWLAYSLYGHPFARVV